jgi:hypothetical protein
LNVERRLSREPDPGPPGPDAAFAALMLLCMTADDAELETCEEALIWLAQDRPGAGVGDALDELRLAVQLGRSDQAALLLPDADLPPRVAWIDS